MLAKKLQLLYWVHKSIVGQLLLHQLLLAAAVLQTAILLALDNAPMAGAIAVPYW
jgi:hypothetical protein